MRRGNLCPLVKVNEYERLKSDLLREFEKRIPDTASLILQRTLSDISTKAAGQRFLFADNVNKARQGALEALFLHASNDPKWKEMGDLELGEDARWRENVVFFVGMLESTLLFERDTAVNLDVKSPPVHGRPATPEERREQFMLLTNDDPNGMD